MLVVFSAFLPADRQLDAITSLTPAALFRIALLLLGGLLRGLPDLLNIVGIEFLAQRLERDARANSPTACWARARRSNTARR